MRKQADDRGVDLLLVDTGDRIEGNGLYDASTPKGIHQYAIFAQQSIDIMCTGNHELYQPYSVDCEHNTSVPNFPDAYIASNLDYIDPDTAQQVPQAQRYRKLVTKNQGVRITAFGFLFDFTGNANNSVVRPVEATVEEDWFQDAIRDKPDLFVVIGHVGLRMEEFRTVFTALRKQNWHVPILFFGGHAHVRDALKFDSLSFAIASGRYMETIGWMSVDGVKKKDADELSSSAAKKPSFSRRYIDNNLYGLQHHCGLDEDTFPTEHGTNVSRMIADARVALHLDRKLGCAPRNLYVSRAQFPGENNIYTWIQDEVFPDIVVTEARADKPRLALINTGGVRFDLFQGRVARDDIYAVSPFTSSFSFVPDVPYGIASKLLGILNSGPNILGRSSPDAKFLVAPEQWPTSRASMAQEKEQERLELRSVQKPLFGAQPHLIGGHTTKDDIDDEGDDTVHEPIEHYKMPNCIQAEIAFPEDGAPETVDLVFIDFLLPWIIPALKFSGGDYEEEDVQEYLEGTFTEHMSNWIEKSWPGDC